MNAASALEVVAMHLDASRELTTTAPTEEPRSLSPIADCLWASARLSATVNGLRNAQVTVLAPTGTIGFLMDCDTTGIEPILGVVTFKKLVGGGYMTLANSCVPVGLSRLGYNQVEVDTIVAYRSEEHTSELQL